MTPFLYERGYGSSIFDEAKPEKSNHAWNAVLINEVWYLLDATWNSGSLDGRNFKKEYSAAYLFLEPERMIYTHFPETPGHQILPVPFSPEEFSQLPFYRGQFFSAGLQPFNDISRLNPVSDRFILHFQAPSNLDFSAQLLDRTGTIQEQRTLVYRSQNMITMMATFPEPGLWALQIFAGESGSNQYGSLVEIGLKSSSGSKETFPLIYGTFTDHKIELQSPLTGPLMSGLKVSFSILLPGYSDAFISTGSQRYSLIKEPETDNFHLDLTIPRVKELTIFGRQNHESREYNAILAYPVDF